MKTMTSVKALVVAGSIMLVSALAPAQAASDINQNTASTGAIVGNSINGAGGLNGMGDSQSGAAIGATSSISGTFNGANPKIGALPSATQVTANNGNVLGGSLNISVGTMKGVGASQSGAAVGASTGYSLNVNKGK